MPSENSRTLTTAAAITFVLAFAIASFLIAVVGTTRAVGATCTVNWTGDAADGLWLSESNWDTNLVPGSADHVCIEPDVVTTVTYASGTTSVLSITTNANGSLAVIGGSLTASSPTEVSTVGADLSSSSSGVVTFASPVVVGALSHTGSGYMAFDGVGSSAGSLLFAASTSSASSEIRGVGSLAVGSLVWQQGAFDTSLAVTVSGSTTMDTVGVKRIHNGASLTLNGPSVWSEGELEFDHGSSLVNNSTMSITHAGLVDDVSGAVSSITNGATGVIDVDASGGTVTVETVFNNDGMLSVAAGSTLGLLGGGTTTGATVDVAATATLRLAGSHTWGGGSNLTGAGDLSVTAGLADFGGQFGFSGDISVSGSGSLTVTGTATVGAVSHTGSGDVTFDGPGSSASSLLFAPASSSAEIRGVGSLTVGSLVWQQGRFDTSLAVTVSGSTTMDTVGIKRINNGASLTLNGPSTWSGGVLWFASGSTLVNNATMSITHAALADIQIHASTVSVTNSATGVVDVTAAGGTVTFDIAFNNDGSLLFAAGSTVELIGGGITTVPVDVPATATLHLAGNHSWGAGSNLTGAGDLSVTAGLASFTDLGLSGNVVVSGSASLTVAGTATVGTLSHIGSGDVTFDGPGSSVSSLLFAASSSSASSEIRGVGSLTVGSLVWQQGAFDTSLAVTVSGSTTMDTVGIKRIHNGASLTLNGPSTWSEGELEFAYGSSLINNSTMSITHAGFVDHWTGAVSSITNGATGVIDVDASGGTVTVDTEFNNQGTLSVAAGSTVGLLGGGTTTGATVDVAATATLRLAGSHTWGGGLNLTGTGTLSVTGGLSSFDDFVFSGEVAVSSSGSLTVAGTATVGTLSHIGSGDVVFDGPGSSAGSLLFAASSSSASSEIRGVGSLTVGSLVWQQGAFDTSLAVTVSGSTTMDTVGIKRIHNGASLTLNGPSTWSEGELEFAYGSSLINNSTMSITHAGFVDHWTGAVSSITNGATGVIDVDASGGTVTVDTEFNNQGTLSVAAGSTVGLLGGGTTTGATVDVAATATLRLAGSHTWGGGLNLTGTGTLSVTGGLSSFDDFVFSGEVAVSSSGSLTVAGTATVGALSHIGSGDVVFDGPGSSAGSLLFAASSSSTDTEIRGVGSLTVGSLVWQQGAFDTSLAVTVSGSTTMDTVGIKRIHNGASLTLNGPSTWSEGELEFAYGSSLINNSTMSITHAGFVDHWTGAVSSITNGATGVIDVDASGGTVTVDTEFNNQGTLSVAAGSTVGLLGGGTTTGATVDVAATATLRLAGSHTWGGGLNLTGTGTLSVTGGLSSFDDFVFSGEVAVSSSGSLTVAGTATVGTLSHIGSGDVTFDGPGSSVSSLLFAASSSSASSEIRGVGSLTVGSLVWQQGAFDTSLAVTVSGSTTMDTVGIKRIHNGASLTLNGPSTWSEGELEFAYGSSLINNSTMSITHAGFVDHWTGAVSSITNGATGVIDVDASGGTVTVDTEFNNQGTLHISEVSIVDVQSTYTQAGSGTLEIEISGTGTPGVDFGQLTGSSVSLAGTFAADAMPSYSPTSLDEFNIVGVSAGIAGNDFSILVDVDSGNSASPPPNEVDGLTHTWEVLYTAPTAVTLSVKNVFPEADPLLDRSASEGDLVSYPAGTFTDPDIPLGDTHTFLWEVVADNGQVIPDATTQAFSFTAEDDGIYTVTFTVTDTFGSKSDVAVSIVTVTNLDPVISSVTNDGPVDEGSSAIVTVVASDVPADTLSFEFDCDGDLTYEVGPQAGNSTSCGFADDGLFTVNVRVSDEDGGSATSSTTVTVTNLDPVISSVTNDGPVDEGSSAIVTVVASDVPADTVLFEFDCDGDLTYEVGPQAGNSTSCGFADDGLFTVNVRVSDEDGGSATSSTTVTVTNLDPVISSVTNDGPVDEGSSAIVTVVASDVPADTVLFEFDCDGDLTYEVGPQAGNTTDCAFGDDGLFTVNVRVTDEDGGSATSSTVVTVLDTTDPVVVIVTPPDGALYLEGDVVLADYTCSDAGSGIASCDGNVATGVAIDTAVLGANTFTVTGTDVAGNSTVVTHSYTVDPVPDTTDPVVVIVTPPDGALYLEGDVVLADYTCSDAGSGIASCDGNVATGVAIDTAVLGANTFTVTGTDVAGNSTVVTHSYTVDPVPDTTDPVVVIVTPPDGAIYVLGDVVLADYTCSDAGSGIASCDGNVATGVAIDTAVLGANTFTVTGTDVAGNSTVVTHSYTVDPVPDTTDPVVVIVTPPDGAIYVLGDVVLADYTCSDAGSGIASCDGNVATGVAIDTATLGANTFTVTGTDVAGNSTVVTHSYTVDPVPDTTDPVVVIVTPADGALYLEGDVVLADYTCSDAGSGIASCDGNVATGVAIDTATLGANTFTVTGTDVAGNSTVVTHSYTVDPVPDTTDPVVVIVTPADGALYLEGDVVLADYTCSDAGSGIASCDGNVATGVAIDTATLGANTFTVTGTDVAGNTTIVTHSYTVDPVPDTTDPVVVIVTPADGALYLEGDVVLADYTCSDAGSGIASCDGNVATGVAIDTATLGANTFTVTGTDVAGNSTVVTHSYTVDPVPDTTDPVVVIVTPADGALYLEGDVVLADYTCSDAGSGIASCDGNVATGVAIDTATLGANTFTVTGTDVAGNSTVVTHSYTVDPVPDTTDPVVVIVTPADGALYLEGDVVLADYTCSDAGSGIASCDGNVATGVAIDTATLGANTFTVTGTDVAGNSTVVTHSYTVDPVPDTTDPVVVIVTPADGALYLEGDVVLADYTCSDAGSGIASCDGNVATGVAIDTATLGANTFTVTGTDVAGNSTVVTHSYTVDPVPDTTDPVVVIVTPADGALYLEGDVVLADYTCSDAGSGIASCDGNVATGVAIDTATLGANTFTVTGTDVAGNSTVVTHSYTVDPVPDTTDPVVVIVTPADGALYLEGDVVLADYTCSDAGSGIASCDGNVATGVAIDTATLGANTFTVTGTDVAGNSTVVTHSYTVDPVPDTTDPVVVIVTPADGALYLEGDVVLADYTCSDAGSGIASCDGNVATGTPIDTATLGANTFTVTGTDVAGNSTVVTHSYTVDPVPDTTDPVVVIVTPADGALYLEGDVVLADYTCSDAGSGIASCDGNVATGVAIDTATLGANTFTVTGTDVAGNSTVVTHSYTVDPVPDTTDPVVVIVTPADGALYLEGDVVLADYTCSDAGSGIASCDGNVATGVAIDTATLGANTFTVTGTDVAGNSTVVTHSYTVDPEAVATLTVEFPGVSRVRVEVRHDDGSVGTAAGALVASRNGRSNDYVLSGLPFGTYDVVLVQGGFTLVVDAVDVASPDVLVAELVATMSVDLENLTSIAVELRTADGSAGTGGELVQNLRNRSGVLSIAVLRGTYELVLFDGKSSLEIDSIDCTLAGTCGPGDVVTTVQVDLGTLTRVRIELRADDGAVGTAIGTRLKVFRRRSGVVSFDVLLGTYDVVLAQRKTPNIVFDSVDCTSGATYLIAV